MTLSETLRRTALFDEHRALGAKLVPFGGFEMPVQYAGILREHDAVRHRAGLFDLSHMGQFELRGDAAAAWADELTVNAVATMKPLQARYNIFCNAAGGALDDVIFYRLPERLLLVVNASNAGKMWEYLSARRPGGVSLSNRHADRSLIAIQGPRSADILKRATDEDVAGMRYYFSAEGSVCGVPAVIARTGYTGEDGFEVFTESAHATRVWRTLLDLGRELGLEAAGLGARDVLRLEAGMPLYGHEMDETITPLQAGLAWAVKLSKPAFVGKDALARQLQADRYPRICGLVMRGRVPARAGYAVFDGEREVGAIRSGSLGPSVGNRNIATALVEKEASVAGTTLSVEVRGERHAADVVELPFYKRK